MTAVIVQRGGLLTTIQDSGRRSSRCWGVPPGGAVDRVALSLANQLVGNDPGRPALECTLEGPELMFKVGCTVALSGADLEPHLNGRPAPMWEGFFVAPGDLLSLLRSRWGARAYIAVAGGFVGARWLGSMSTALGAGRGGLGGRALITGDQLEIGSAAPTPPIVGQRVSRPAIYDRSVLRILPGPHFDLLGRSGRAALLGGQCVVNRESDRMGCRLDGPLLKLEVSDLLSFGVTAGCLQVTGAGQLILLLADHQTTGGYPVVATVIRADLPRAAQLVPGESITLSQVTLAEALAAWAEVSPAPFAS